MHERKRHAVLVTLSADRNDSKIATLLDVGRNDRWLCSFLTGVPTVMHSNVSLSVMVLGIFSEPYSVQFLPSVPQSHIASCVQVLEMVVNPWIEVVA